MSVAFTMLITIDYFTLIRPWSPQQIMEIKTTLNIIVKLVTSACLPFWPFAKNTLCILITIATSLPFGQKKHDTLVLLFPSFGERKVLFQLTRALRNQFLLTLNANNAGTWMKVLKMSYYFQPCASVHDSFCSEVQPCLMNIKINQFDLIAFNLKTCIVV